MRKFIHPFLSLLLAALLALGIIPGTGPLVSRTAYAAGFAGGEGTSANPYQIANADQLDLVRNYLNNDAVHFELISDIDLIDYSTGTGWTPIGTAGSGTLQFTGSMDGNGHVIRNLKINRPGVAYVGLFGATSVTSRIQNMKLEHVDITGGDYTGSLVGRDRGTIRGSSASGSVVGAENTGGLAGTASGEICDNFAHVNVKGTEEVGGLVGGVVSGTVCRSFATGDVTGDENVGGLIGLIKITHDITVSNSFASGDVSGTTSAGGLIGFIRSDTGNGITIENSYAIGKVSSEPGNVGFTPNHADLTVKHSYYDVETTGHAGSGAGVGKSTADMKNSATYSDWDLPGTWSMDPFVNDGYPYLTELISSKVRYDKNGADASGLAPAEVVCVTDTAMTVANQGTLGRDGYTFMGWNTAIDGSGTTYQAGDVMPCTNKTLYAVWISAQAALADLSSDQGAWSAAYNPSDPSGSSYQVDVHYPVESVQLYIEKRDPDQTVTVTGATYVSSDLLAATYSASNLSVGANPVQIQVTAPDHLNSHTYIVTINRAPASDNANLSGLTLSDGVLAPPYNPGITAYSASVANRVTSVTVTAVTYDANATLQIAGLPAASGVPSGSIALSTGNNPIFITVEAQDGTIRSYTVAVSRANASSDPGPACAKKTSTTGSFVLPACWEGDLSLNGEAGLFVPIDATDHEGTFTIEQEPNADRLLTNGEMPLSPAFLFTMDGADRLLKPATVKLAFDPSRLEAGGQAGIFYYDDDDGDWAALPTAEIKDGQIFAETQRLGIFIVLAVDANTGDPVADAEPEPESEPVPSTQSHFSDIAGHWAASFIEEAFARQLIQGYPDGTFRPDRSVTRAEFIVMLAGAFKWEGTGARLDFTDQDRIGIWAQRAVAFAVQEGIVNGYDDGGFRPDAFITREEMAVMIARALQLQLDVHASGEFADHEAIAYWAKDAVAAMRRLGIFIGRGDDLFMPTESATRAEATVLLLQLLES